MKFPFNIPSVNEFDAVGFGTNAVDYLIRVPAYPAFNSKVELTEHTVAPGGEVASTMAGLNRLGFLTAYAGRFGGDLAGELGLRSLVEEGVDVTYCETVPAARTQVAYIIIDEHTGERTVLWQRDQQLAYHDLDAPTDLAKRGRVLHITPHDTLACIAMAKTARAAGVLVSIDLDNVFPRLEELLPLVDICIASSDLPSKMFGISDIQEALREFRARFHCPLIGLTLGENGSIFFCNYEFIETPGFEVPGGCVDTTGAGDAFRTGFLYGVLSGATVEQSARAANAVAALKCRSFGARSGLPNLKDLQALLK